MENVSAEEVKNELAKTVIDLCKYVQGCVKVGADSDEVAALPEMVKGIADLSLVLRDFNLDEESPAKKAELINHVISKPLVSTQNSLSTMNDILR